jgi:hypothetical protein
LFAGLTVRPTNNYTYLANFATFATWLPLARW